MERAQRLEDFIQDACAFVKWATENNQQKIIGVTLAHDVCGLANYEPCFCPRVDGYCETMDKMRMDSEL